VGHSETLGRAESVDALISNFTSPVVLAYALGVVARLARSDLEIPRPVYQGISIYLLLAIGLKGGVELSKTPFVEIAGPLGVTLLMGVLTPILAFAVLRFLGRMDVINASAIAAHYGSVSAVTFIAAISYTQTQGLEPEGFMPTLLALLEVPGIMVALLIPHFMVRDSGVSLRKAVHEVATGGSIVLLAGGLVIGFLAGPTNFAPIEPFFVSGFQGALVIFLLELGMVTASRLGDLKKAGWFLGAFAVVMPVVFGTMAIVAALFAGLSVAGATVFAAMVSSGSYIAAPAAVRIALPKASPALYLTASLGITFPFNIALGIPLYLVLAQLLSSQLF
jgi:uncharacterized protein